ncbi:hypothetical protein GQ457_01G037240 [Hibiscus cannabinus]
MKSKKVVLGDESTSLGALLTLANLSTAMLPMSTVESESSAKLNENRTILETDEESSASIGHHRDKSNYISPKEKMHNLNTRAEDGTSSKSKVGSYLATVENVVSKPKLQLEPTSNSKKRKSKSFSASQDSPTNNDLKISETDSAVSTLQVPAEPELVSLPNKYQSRCKMNLKRGLLSTDKNTPRYTLENQPNKQSLSRDRLKEKLSSCLSSDLARRLCSFEWFYSAVGCTWFAKKEFVDSFGESWRFSELLLLEEREKPKLYRESVRQHCTQLCIGTMEVLPIDLSLPLSVGQHAIAIHPGTREVNDGKFISLVLILKISYELLEDIDCMPLNPLENFPETLRRKNLDVDDFSMIPVSRSYIDGAQKLEWRCTGKKKWRSVYPTNQISPQQKPPTNSSLVVRRTPRVLVLYSYKRDEIESYDPPKERVIMSEADDNDNGCAPAVRLTGALQRRSCSKFSQKPYNKVECRKSTPVQSYDRMIEEVGLPREEKQDI